MKTYPEEVKAGSRKEKSFSVYLDSPEGDIDSNIVRSGNSEDGGTVSGT